MAAPRRGAAGVWAGALVAAAVLSAGCDVRMGEGGGFSFDLARGHASDTWTRSYTVAAGGVIEIINVNGEVRAEASDGGTVEVTAERRASASSDDAARDLLQRIQMREEVGPAKVRIETISPRISFGGQQVRYTVRVPRGVHVDLRTVNGGVRLEGVGGEVRAASTNGGIKGRVADASLVEARTTNGGVELDLSGALADSGRMTLSSVNGGVRLRVPEGVKADVSARCTNGRVSVSDLSFEAEGEQSRRRLAGRINGGGGRIDLTTVNGGVAIGRS